MKRIVAILLVLCISVVFGACGGKTQKKTEDEEMERASAEEEEQEIVEISLWTYPVGHWGNSTTVANLLASFYKQHPDIRVSVEYLDYSTGDEQINEALEEGTAPDLVFEGPERLVANWGAQGLMVDLSDLWTTENVTQIYEHVEAACRHVNGEYYEFPVCMTAHCMAINYDLFEAAGALQYLDVENRTWTTEGFIQAVQALTAYGIENVGAVFCQGQGGDQGTRALVNNLYGGTFTNQEHTAYTVNSEENIQALQLLYDLEGIHYDPEIVGSDEIEKFCSGELAMAFCWNASQEITQTVHNPNLNFDILPMTYPTNTGEPKLTGGIWGFGIFDSKDEKRIEAAKTFIAFMTEDNDQYAKAVLTSTHWPVREIGNIYANDDLMTEYSMFLPYMGDYYQVTSGWTEARTQWWQMLQKIGAGQDIRTAVEEFSAAVNPE